MIAFARKEAMEKIEADLTEAIACAEVEKFDDALAWINSARVLVDAMARTQASDENPILLDANLYDEDVPADVAITKGEA